jgi:hypothetical protein
LFVGGIEQAPRICHFGTIRMGASAQQDRPETFRVRSGCPIEELHGQIDIFGHQLMFCRLQQRIEIRWIADKSLLEKVLGSYRIAKEAEFHGQFDQSGNVVGVRFQRAFEGSNGGFMISLRAVEVGALRQGAQIARIAGEQLGQHVAGLAITAELAQFGNDLEPGPEVVGVDGDRLLEMSERLFAIAAPPFDLAKADRARDRTKGQLRRLTKDCFGLVQLKAFDKQ